MVNMSLREFLEKREAEVKAARASLLIELKEIKKAQKAISPQEAAGKKEYNTENKFTIKEMIKHVLLDNKAGGKPEEIIEKMLVGRLRKYYEEVCLLEQGYVIDGENTVGKAVELFAKDLGSPVTLTGFVRYQLGEGIEKKEEDFAAEVAATLGN